MRRIAILLTVSALATCAWAQQRRQPQPLTPEQVRKLVPDGVRWTPDIAYREGHPAWKLDLAVPEAKTDRPRPGMVIVHGGGWRGGDKRVGQWARLPLEFAQRGYVAVSVNYRMLPEFTIRNCVEDVKNAVRWLRAHADKYDLDPDRIGAYGNSAGAHLVSMLGLAGPEAGFEGDGPYREHSSSVKAVVASATPTDFLRFSEDAGREPPAGRPWGDNEEAKALSPLSYAAADAPPILLVHGTADRTVPVAQAKRFFEALREAGAKDVRLMLFEGDGHGVFQQQRLLTYPAMTAFFDRYLQSPQAEGR